MDSKPGNKCTKYKGDSYHWGHPRKPFFYISIKPLYRVSEHVRRLHKSIQSYLVPDTHTSDRPCSDGRERHKYPPVKSTIEQSFSKKIENSDGYGNRNEYEHVVLLKNNFTTIFYELFQ